MRHTPHESAWPPLGGVSYDTRLFRFVIQTPNKEWPSVSASTIEIERLGQDELDPHVHDRRWVILGVLCMSLLIIVIDNTILNVAIPSLIRDLDASNSQIQWIIDSYVIVFAGLLLTTGSMSDRFGRKGALQAGLVLFALGSIASASVDTANQLIFTRAFMGIGGALIMPSTLSILTNVFRNPKERGRAIGDLGRVPGPDRDRPPALLGVTEDVGEDRQRRGHDQRPADAHEGAGEDQLIGGVDRGRCDRAEGEQHETALEAHPCGRTGRTCCRSSAAGRRRRCT